MFAPATTHTHVKKKKKIKIHTHVCTAQNKIHSTAMHVSDHLCIYSKNPNTASRETAKTHDKLELNLLQIMELIYCACISFVNLDQNSKHIYLPLHALSVPPHARILEVELPGFLHESSRCLPVLIWGKTFAKRCGCRHAEKQPRATAREGGREKAQDISFIYMHAPSECGHIEHQTRWQHNDTHNPPARRFTAAVSKQKIEAVLHL